MCFLFHLCIPGILIGNKNKLPFEIQAWKILSQCIPNTLLSISVMVEVADKNILFAYDRMLSLPAALR
jgi:hypothetical protein